MSNNIAGLAKGGTDAALCHHEPFLLGARPTAARGFPRGVHWVSEDVLPETWPIRQRPDALLVDDAGQYVRAVEYGGDYPEERLIDLHLGLSSIPLSYEIW